MFRNLKSFVAGCESKLWAILCTGVLFMVSAMPITDAEAGGHQWAAERVSQSYTEVYMRPEADMTFVVSFKNIGTSPWHNNTLRRGYVALNVREKSQFEHRYWRDWEHPCVIQQPQVNPGQEGTCRFAFKAPSALGAYTLKLELAAEKVAWIEGGVFELPVVVTLDPAGDRAVREEAASGGRLETSADMTVSSNDLADISDLANTPALPAPVSIVEPLDFRVGLFYRDESVSVTNAGLFRLTDPNGNVIAEYGGGTIVTVSYQGGVYHVTTPAGTVTYGHYLRFVPGDGNAEGVFELTNVDNRPAWNPNINENKFRGIIEYRFNPPTGRIWTINELSLEAYMLGIGEIGERAPADALKTTAVAARGYAYDMYRANSKYNGFFHVANSQSDQLFGGYNHEVNRPNFVGAVKATQGEMVAYEGNPVITPYFSQSKGYTRGWHEIWGGKAKPWLMGVTVPCDEGQRGIGHGVGLSQQASICMAQEGMGYQDILKFFYTGTTVLKFY